MTDTSGPATEIGPVTLSVGESASQWARRNGTRWHYTIGLDGHDLPRQTAGGEAFEYRVVRQVDTGTRAYAAGERTYVQHGIVVPNGTGLIPHAVSSTFIIDNGTTVTPWYVASWHPDTGDVQLMPMTPGNIPGTTRRAMSYYVTLRPSENNARLRVV